MKEYHTNDLFDLFDDKGGTPPPPPKEAAPPTPPEEQSKKKKKRKPKKNGVFILPVYKAAYDSYKECQFRFRKVSGDGKAIAREVTSNLKRIMVDIELVYWQVKPKSILPETFSLVMETVIIIRAMKDFGDLSTKDFGIISKYTSQLSTNMRIWSEHHQAQADAAVQNNSKQ